MRLRILALLLIGVAGAARASAPDLPLYYTELPPGRYTVDVRGMLCTVCARAIAAEWAKLPEVEKASVDFDREQAVIAVRLDRTLQVNALRKALRRAEKTANLGAHFDLRQIQYVP